MILDRRGRVRQISKGSLKGVVVIDSMIDHFLLAQRNLDDLFQNSSLLLKCSASTRSALVDMRVSRPSGDLEKLFVKEFRFKNLIHSLKPHFYPHRAQIAWDVSWHLLSRGILVPQPEGFLVKWRGLFCHKGYFFCKELARCSSLGELSGDPKRLCERFDLGGLIGVLARNIALLHESGVTHGDLKWSNILVHEEQNKLWIVDLDSARHNHREPAGPKAIARDLARFALSGLESGIDETIMDRFLDEYAHLRKMNRKSIDEPVTRILEKFKHRHMKKYQDEVRR